jgi:hypothetical protein
MKIQAPKAYFGALRLLITAIMMWRGNYNPLA